MAKWAYVKKFGMKLSSEMRGLRASKHRMTLSEIQIHQATYIKEHTSLTAHHNKSRKNVGLYIH